MEALFSSEMNLSTVRLRGLLKDWRERLNDLTLHRQLNYKLQPLRHHLTDRQEQHE